MLYSPLKVFHHRDRIDTLKRGEQPSPAQVQLIITNRCNQRCRFCAYRMPGYPSNQLFKATDEIPYAKILEILDDAQGMGVGAIQLTGGGEPSIHPEFTQVCQAVIDRGMDLALATNGSVVPDEAIDVLARATWVRVSLDAGRADTYQSLRRVKSEVYVDAWRTIDRLIEAKHRLGGQVVIGIGFVVTRENFREVVTATEMARQHGVDNIRLSAVFQPDGADYFSEIHPEAVELCRAAKSLETDTFRVFNNFDHRFEDLELAHPNYQFCGIQHFDTYIGADLNVYRCCTTAYNRRGLIGSIRERRFRELWESDEKRASFADFDARGCEFCMFNQKNRTIAYAISKNPPHVNFV
jgi:MoaA/NifB/PqqE/SkfB family radical SAM enzyme